MKIRFAVLAVILLVSVTVSGCGSAKTDGGDKRSAGNEAPRLTKENLPTEVGTTWTTVRSPEGGVDIEMTVEGPWRFTAGPDWAVDSYEIVDPATVPELGAFSNVSFVTKNTYPDSPEYYYPRTLTDEWVDHLGRITVTDGVAVAEPTDKRQHFWPLNYDVGQEYEVGETDISTIKATVLARNTARVPAGTIDHAYLVRFEYTSKADGAVTTYYYLFAADVGVVALIHPSAGNEKDGFTAAEQVDLLATMPAVR